MRSAYPLFFFIFSFSFVAVVFSDTDPLQLAFLVAIAQSNSLNPKIASWTGSDPCSSKWDGIFCKGSSITQLQLQDFHLTGNLPPELNRLTSLTAIALQGNNFYGPLPSFNGLSSLTKAYLGGGNRFESIPADFFKGLISLTTLSLEDNPLNSSTGGWSLPNDITASVSLQTLILNNCSLSGEIPDFLGTMTSLQNLEMAYNSLNGGLPSSFKNANFVNLILNNQNLEGEIGVVGSMQSLTTLWLHVNEFTGPIPENLSVSLQDCRLNDNKLVGEIPSDLVTSSSLKYLSVQHNNLLGELPDIPLITDPNNYTYYGNHFCVNKTGVACAKQVTILLSFLEGVFYPSPLVNSWISNDPCDSTWLGIGCDKGGNVTSISLSSLHLNGSISAALGNLTYLTKLVLNNNNLTGSIPDSLATLSFIQIVDVSNNNLYAPVPSFANGVLIDSGNPNINTVYSPPSTPISGTSPISPINSNTTSLGGSSSLSLGPIIGSILGAVAVVFILSIGGFLAWKKKQQRIHREQIPNAVENIEREDNDVVKIAVEPSTEQINQTSNGHSGPSVIHVRTNSDSMLISIQVLRSVTNNFSEENVLGRGGFGVVYKGELDDGTKIAVKRMESLVVSKKGLSEFQAEIDVLTKVRHRHLVSLLGYCIEGDERLLVYEYMPMGTLSQHLFECSKFGFSPLSWNRRLTIALDVARGIEYLHSLAHRSFIHRDLKPSNILLGDDYRAKVSDFGLVKLAPEGMSSVETKLAGTFGYLAPEYAATGRVTTKSDVFSFGVILMEIITGRRALDEKEPDESMHLVPWFRRMLTNHDAFVKVIDPAILAEVSSSSATDGGKKDETLESNVYKVAELAGHCTAREPCNRPDMGHAVGVLSLLVEAWKPIDANGGDDDDDGIDLNLPLSQALKKWQSLDDSVTSADMGNTQTSLPSRPTGFADSFTSSDGR